MLNHSQESQNGLEAALVEHARLGLKRIHTVCQSHSSGQKSVGEPKQNASKPTAAKKNKKKAKAEEKATKPETRKITYLNTKKPIEKSVFYQHSRQGMKYWYEEEKTKTYNSKIPMGRKGTLLGLVDAPLK